MSPRCAGAGQGGEITENSSPDTALALEHQGHVDLRLALLLRAAAKLYLVEAGYQDLVWRWRR